jgi:hypothetical protein
MKSNVYIKVFTIIVLSSFLFSIINTSESSIIRNSNSKLEFSTLTSKNINIKNSFGASNKSHSREKNINTKIPSNPTLIENYTSGIPDFDINKIKVDLNNDNPLATLKLKQEIEQLYKKSIDKKVFNPHKKKNSTPVAKYKNNNQTSLSPYYRFKSHLGHIENEFTEPNYNKDDVNQNLKPATKDSEILVTKPNLIGKIGAASNKETLSDEEAVPMYYVSASSTYTNLDDEQSPQLFNAKNIMRDDKFWCSTGGHGIEEIVKFTIEFPRSYRLSSLWIHWAFAPGKFMIQTSNKMVGNDIIIDDSVVPLIPWRFSVKNKDINFWKSVISNPSTRWNYKSFDERIVLNEKIWAKYIVISMSIPVNQYFGIYKLEFYTKSKSIVQLRSKVYGEDLCLTAVNGSLGDETPVVAMNCVQSISYGDNRDLFVLNTNGYITTFKNNKCLESSNPNQINILDCGKSSDFKDNREKWILDYDGKIRSQKEEYTCLSVTDQSVKDYVEKDNVKVSATSTYEDGIHDAKNVFDYFDGTFWISGLGKIPVTFEIYMFKFPYTIKNIEIVWKFPAKKFQVLGLLSDGYWRSFYKHKNNRESTNIINTMNRDLHGIKIIMKESTTKVGDGFIYGILNIYLHTGARFLKREPCKDVLMNANLFEILDTNSVNEVVGNELMKSRSILDKSMTKLKMVQSDYANIPNLLVDFMDKNFMIKDELNSLITQYEDVQLKLGQFGDLVKEKNINVFTLGSSDLYPAIDCYHIIKAYPSKRSGFYWIKTDCMPKSLKVYCDFDSYNNKAGLDFYIFNDNQLVNSIMRDVNTFKDLYSKCASIGLEPINIKNVSMINIIYNILKFLGYNLNTDKVIPLAYDFGCDQSKCSGKFQAFTSDKLNDINDIIDKFIKYKGEGIKQIFDSNNDDDDIITNTSAFGINDNINKINLLSSPISGIICSSNSDGLKNVKNYKEVTCDQNLRDDVFSEYQIFTSIKILCPPNCHKSKGKIFGSKLFTDNSSACMAAIHQGVIVDTNGGIAEIKFEKGLKYYSASQGHGIESFEYTEEWDRSFSVKKYEPFCPLNNVKDYNRLKLSQLLSSSSSFIEISNNTNNINKDSNKIQIQSTNSNSENNQSVNEIISLLEQKLKKLNDSEIQSMRSKIENLVVNKTSKSRFKEISKDEKETKILTNAQIPSIPENAKGKDKDLNELTEKINKSNSEMKNKLFSDLNKSLENFKQLMEDGAYKDLPFDQKKVVDKFANTIKFLQSEANSSTLSAEKISSQLNSALSSTIKSTVNNNFNASEKSKVGLSNSIMNNVNSSLTSNLNNMLSSNSNSKFSTGPSSVNPDNSNTDPNSDPNSQSTNNAINQIYRDNQINNLTNNSETPTVRNSDQTNALTLAKLMKDIRTSQKKAQQKNDEVMIRNLMGFKVPESKTTTEVAELYINALIEKERNLLKELQLLAENFKKIVGQAVYTLDQINNDKTKGLKNLTHVFKTLENKKTKVNMFLYELDSKAKNKISNINHEKLIAEQRVKSFYIREAFNEDYSNNDLLQVYDIFTSKKGKGNPPKWEYFMYNLDGHVKVISQKGNYQDNRTGSHLIIKNRDYYDFELKFAVYIKGNKTFGVNFRRKNDFSYYIFQISNEDKGYKRVLKYNNGYSTKIVEKFDGGFLENTWYYIKIRAQQANFKIYISTTSENLDKMYDLVFEFEDNEHIHGTVGFASQGIEWLLIDNISIVPLTCTNYDKPRSDQILIVTPICSRFSENFKHDYKQRWIIKDPKEFIDGPSVWIHNPIEEELHGNEIKLNPINYGNKSIILQNSKIQGTNNNQEGGKLMLSSDLYSCSKGKISLKIKPLDNNGIVGVIFRSENDHYYILEISNKFVRLRKKIDDNYYLLSINETLGYQISIAQMIVISLNNDRINAFISKNGEFSNLMKVFPEDIVDSSLKYGSIGLSSYKTRSYFEDILMNPVDLTEEYESNIFIDDDEDPILKQLPKIKDSRNIFDSINSSVENSSSWNICLKYPMVEDRRRYCNVNFSGGPEKKHCSVSLFI